MKSAQQRASSVMRTEQHAITKFCVEKTFMETYIQYDGINRKCQDY